MSLQVWLPFTGKTDNLGLGNNITLEQTGTTTFSDDGKFGKCKTGGTTITSNRNPMGCEGTICFWIYVDDNYEISNGNCLFGNNPTTAIAGNRKWSLFLFPNRNSLHSWGCQFDDTSNTPNGSWTLNNVIPDGVWTHVTVAHDAQKQYIYINGILKSTISWNSTGNLTFDVNTIIVSPNTGAKFNDLRIYDECLSKEQIHQISQGLILHYPLNSGYGNENLVPNLSQYTQLSPYIRKTSAVDGCVWMQGTTFICEPSTTYTIQVKSDGTCVDTHGGSHSASEKAFSIWLYLCNENTSKDPYTGQYDNPICLKNNNYSYEKKGNMYIWKYTTPSTTKYMSMRINGYSNGTDSTSIKFWDFKIEKGKDLTYPVPNQADDLYSQLGYDSTTVYDTSGFGNNGVMVNNIIHTSDTPLYDSSINLQRINSNYIDLQNTYITNQSTINLWGKVNTFNNYQRFFEFCNALQGATGSHRITLGTYQSTQQLALRIYGGDTGITSLYVNNITTIDTNWHMYSIVFNKTNLKVFIDGTSIVDATMTQELTSMVRQYSYIGKSSYSGDSYFDGNISDFRIYSTALSAEDIKQLYESKARIDKNGNVYCNQFIESGDMGNSNVDKKGILHTNNFIEIKSEEKCRIFKQDIQSNEIIEI